MTRDASPGRVMPIVTHNAPRMPSPLCGESERSAHVPLALAYGASELTPCGYHLRADEGIHDTQKAEKQGAHGNSVPEKTCKTTSRYNTSPTISARSAPSRRFQRSSSVKPSRSSSAAVSDALCVSGRG